MLILLEMVDASKIGNSIHSWFIRWKQIRRTSVSSEELQISEEMQGIVRIASNRDNIISGQMGLLSRCMDLFLACY